MLQDILNEHVHYVHKHEIVFWLAKIGQKIITLFFIEIRDEPIFDIKVTKYVFKKPENGTKYENFFEVSNMGPKRYKNEHKHKNEDNIVIEDNLINENYLTNEYDLKNEHELQMKMTSWLKTT